MASFKKKLKRKMKNIFCTYQGFKKTFFLGYIYIYIYIYVHIAYTMYILDLWEGDTLTSWCRNKFQKLGNFQELNYLTIKENK